MSAALALRAELPPLARYDAMCHAIAAAHAVDEAKDIRDKAMAMEVYFRQARNTEAERQAAEIRLRAERKGGELLAEREMAPAGRPPENRSQPVTDSPATLADLGITKRQSADWQKLAQVPQRDFDAALADPAWRPTTSGIIERHEAGQRGEPPPTDKVDHGALWLWGRLQEFDRMGLLDREPAEVMATMLAHMKQTTKELAPRVAAWLGRF